jgi:hypothetical protein
VQARIEAILGPPGIVTGFSAIRLPSCAINRHTLLPTARVFNQASGLSRSTPKGSPV